MREILFRGKDVKENWHIGLLAKSGNGWYISNSAGIPLAYEVIPSTVGQFTGLKDNNGKKIFEGDIVKSCEYDDTYTIKYFGDDNYPAFDCVSEVKSCECNGLAFLVNIEGCEIVGNIHDNPELLKEAEQE